MLLDTVFIADAEVQSESALAQREPPMSRPTKLAVHPIHEPMYADTVNRLLLTLTDGASEYFFENPQEDTADAFNLAESATAPSDTTGFQNRSVHCWCDR